jgi:hypothetical protein
MSANQELRGTNAALQWQRDARHRWAGQESWFFGDARCDRLANRPQGLPCDAVAAEQDGFRSELWFPPVELPADSALVLSGFWFDGRDADPFADPTATPVLRFETVDAGGIVRTVWSSANETPHAGWRPLLADLGVGGASAVRLRVVIEAMAGAGRRDRSFGLESLQIRVPCATERNAPATSPICGDAQPVAIQMTADTLFVRMPNDPSVPCQACTDDADCPVSSSMCGASRCIEQQWCGVGADADTTCCGFDDASGRIPLAIDAWNVSGDPWINHPDDDSLWFPLATFDGIPFGIIESGAFVAPEPNPVLSLQLRLATEWSAPGTVMTSTGVDRLTIAVVPMAGPFEPARTFEPVTFWDSSAIGGTTLGETMTITAALPMAAGTRFRLRLTFDAVDPDFNDYDGVRIFSARLGARCRPCGPAESCFEAPADMPAENPVDGAFPP